MAGEKRTTPRPRFEPPQLWDDVAFRKRLAALAQSKGISVKKAMEEIGLTIDFAYRAADSRPSNLLMVVANYFQISPAELAGWTVPPETPQSMIELNHQGQELTVKLAEIFSQQTARMLFIALSVARTGGADPKVIAALAEMLKSNVNGEAPALNDQHSGTS